MDPCSSIQNCSSSTHLCFFAAEILTAALPIQSSTLTKTSDFDTTHPEQHEKEATSFIAKCTVKREVPCVSRHPATTLDEKEQADFPHVSHGDNERGGSCMN